MIKTPMAVTVQETQLIFMAPYPIIKQQTEQQKADALSILVKIR